MLRMSLDERRARLMRRHRLAAGATASTVREAVDGVLVLHATDPATVYLSVLARCPQASIADLAAAMYDERSLVKLIAMRRTMFVAPFELVPTIHSAAGLGIAKRLRKQLINHLGTVPTEPQIQGNRAAWLADVENGTEKALIELGEAFAAEIAKAEPRLRTATVPVTEKKWDVKANITSRVLTLMGADGRIVRGRPGGTWVSRQHRWFATRELWPDGLPDLPEADARAELVERWLRAFGPATVADVRWWTGWTLGDTRKALAAVDTVPVDLDGIEGIVLADDVEPEAPVAASAAFLPALDPTPMGWQQRDWYLGPHRPQLFDRNGNIGPTVWWDGRIVGGWGMRSGGEVAWRLLEDVGAEAEAAVAAAAAALEPRIEGVTVIPSFRTPLERELSA